MKRPVATEIVKEYPQRGPMQQFRLGALTAFHCFRCGQAKKSKLLVVYDWNWDRLLCNGCYGRLLSIYEIKAGTKPEDEKASELADLLLSLFSKDQLRENERLFASQRKERIFFRIMREDLLLLPSVFRRYFNWMRTWIGYQEPSVFVKPLKLKWWRGSCSHSGPYSKGSDLTTDVKDKDIGRVAKFFADPTAKPPEMGAFAHFLRTSLNSESRRTTSPVVAALFQLFSSLPNSGWLSSVKGLHESLVRLTRDFRNPAAHLDTLTRQDYDECRTLVLGPEGILWKLIAATQTGKV